MVKIDFYDIFIILQEIEKMLIISLRIFRNFHDVEVNAKVVLTLE